jgi:hypothetical protein
VERPAEPVKPQVALSSPQQVGPCDPVVLEAIVSSPRSLRFVWGCSSDRAIDSFLSSSSSLSSVVVPSALLTRLDFQYQFSLQVVDFLGTRSDTIQSGVTRVSVAAPLLRVLGNRPCNSLRLPFPTSPSPDAFDEDVLLLVEADFSSCPGARSDLRFAWRQISAQSSALIPTRLQDVASSSLFIVGGNLRPGTPPPQGNSDAPQARATPSK